MIIKSFKKYCQRSIIFLLDCYLTPYPSQNTVISKTEKAQKTMCENNLLILMGFILPFKTNAKYIKVYTLYGSLWLDALE
jgi:hypothetical protein